MAEDRPNDAAGPDNPEYRQRALARKRKHEELAELESKKDAIRNQLAMRSELDRSKTIQRDYDRDFLSKVGTRQIVDVANGEKQGFKCSLTGHVAHDSLSYLNHINGRKQQRALGMSMRVKRSTPEEVQQKLEEHRQREKEEEQDEKSFEERVEQSLQEELLQKQRRKEKKKQKKEEKRKQKEEEDQQWQQGVDPELVNMMGFSGFGSKK